MMLLVAAVGLAQQPNGPPQGTTVQGQTSLMYGGAHDLGFHGTIGNVGQTDTSICDYCHRPHTPGGMAGSEGAPLWARGSIVSRSAGTYPVYSSVSLDIAPTPVNNDNNYSSFCLSCHDGSHIFSATDYATADSGQGLPHGFSGTYTADTVQSAYSWQVPGNTNPNAQQSFTHLHPVHFNYAAVVAADPGGFFAAQTANYVYLNTTTTPNQAQGRLFGGDMECSSCHDPHFKTGIGFRGSTANGGLCVACHQK